MDRSGHLFAATLKGWTRIASFLVFVNGVVATEFSVTFDDSGGVLAEFRDRMESHALAAAGDWGEVFESEAQIEIVVRPSAMIPRASGRSLTAVFARLENGVEVYEQGAAAEIRNGTDPNGASPDIELTFNVNYVRDELWFDPDPAARTATPDPTRTDAMSVFLHELGHAFAYNGWRDGATGELVSGFASTYDILIERDGADWFFVGPSSLAVWGEPIAVTRGNARHIGNSAPTPGERLIPALMNGIVYFLGERYWITALDRAVLQDIGLPVSVPPTSVPVEMQLALFDGALRLEALTRPDRVYRVDASALIGQGFEFYRSFFGDGSPRTLDLGDDLGPSLFLRGGEWR